jgi:hypothetical protein
MAFAYQDRSEPRRLTGFFSVFLSPAWQESPCNRLASLVIRFRRIAAARSTWSGETTKR